MSESGCSQSDCSTSPMEAPKKLIIRGLVLAGLTVLYNLIEAGVALWEGWRQGSIALVGFGLDSLIEITAAGFIVWRLWVHLRHQDAQRVEQVEDKARYVVGVTFLLLAMYILIQAGVQLFSGTSADESVIGIGLAIVSITLMPLLAWGKIRVARQINSPALEMEAKETIACMILSVILLAGLAINALLGWWWADPAAALVMVPWLVKEGRAGLRGESCCS